MSYALFFPAAMWLDNVPLTDQGRAPVVITRQERSIQNELANGDLRKYIKAVKHEFSTSWQWLPDLDEQTLDGGAGRKTLDELIGNDNGNSHSLRMFERNGGSKDYVVFVGEFTQELIKRDPSTGIFLWTVSVTFIEV